MTTRQRTIGLISSVLLFAGAIVLGAFGYRGVSVVLFIVAGIGSGIFGPAVRSDNIHGASDST